MAIQMQRLHGQGVPRRMETPTLAPTRPTAEEMAASCQADMIECERLVLHYYAPVAIAVTVAIIMTSGTPPRDVLVRLLRGCASRVLEARFGWVTVILVAPLLGIGSLELDDDESVLVALLSWPHTRLWILAMAGAALRRAFWGREPVMKWKINVEMGVLAFLALVIAV